jgi:hypothetical protein
VCPRCSPCSRQDRVGDRPQRLVAGGGLRVESRLEDAAKHPRDVGIDQRSARLIRERRDRACRVRTDAGQCAQRIWRRWQAASTNASLGHFRREAVKISRTRVIAESLPRLAHARRRRGRNRSQRRKCAEERRVLRDDARHLRLLEHQLRHENPIRIARAPPRQVARAPAVPRAQPATEIESLPGRQLG